MRPALLHGGRTPEVWGQVDSILSEGERQHEGTKGKYARAEERKLLNRLAKYKENHLLFLHDFAVPFSDNMSARDLRICKTRQKMSGGFRTGEGLLIRGLICVIDRGVAEL